MKSSVLSVFVLGALMACTGNKKEELQMTASGLQPENFKAVVDGNLSSSG